MLGSSYKLELNKIMTSNLLLVPYGLNRVQGSGVAARRTSSSRSSQARGRRTIGFTSFFRDEIKMLHFL